MKPLTTQQITRIGLMAALVFATNYISIPIGGNMRLHLGNACVLLSGFYLGAPLGGLAAGVGAAMFDLLSPGGMFVMYAPFTFIMRFAMAFAAGALANGVFVRLLGRMRPVWRNMIAAIAASLLYVLMFMIQVYVEQQFIRGQISSVAMGMALSKGSLSLVNVAFGVILATPLSLVPLAFPSNKR